MAGNEAKWFVCCVDSASGYPRKLFACASRLEATARAEWYEEHGFGRFAVLMEVSK